jgi:hypothetical protein
VLRSLLSIAIRGDRGDCTVGEGDWIPAIVFPFCMDMDEASKRNMRESD